MDGAKGGAGQVGADEDALDVDRAAFELGGLEWDHDCDAVLWAVGCQLPYLSFKRNFKRKRMSMGHYAARSVQNRFVKRHDLRWPIEI